MNRNDRPQLPDFFETLTPATQLMVQRRLELGDLDGTDFLMKAESVETRRKYELWKMRQGLVETKTEWRSGPGRLCLDELEAEMQERRKTIAKMLGKASGNEGKKEPQQMYVSTLHINVPLTVLIPNERETVTATAVLGLRSDYC